MSTICRQKIGIAAFHDLVELVMGQEPYKLADRGFWITDNGSSHRGRVSVRRLAAWYLNAVQVHLPIHASWLNQVEIYFSVLRRKVLTPNEFASLEEVEATLLAFERRYEQTAQPFEWKFTRSDLERLVHRLNAQAVANPVLVA